MVIEDYRGERESIKRRTRDNHLLMVACLDKDERSLAREYEESRSGAFLTSLFAKK